MNCMNSIEKSIFSSETLFSMTQKPDMNAFLRASVRSRDFDIYIRNCLELQVMRWESSGNYREGDVLWVFSFPGNNLGEDGEI